MVVLTEKQIDDAIKGHELAEYPKSKKFYIGFNLARDEHIDAAITSWKRGAAEDSCVSCMYFLARTQYEKKNNIHLAYPWVVEAVIRGHKMSMGLLTNIFYIDSVPKPSAALINFVFKILEEFGNKDYTSEQRKIDKKRCFNVCFSCGKIDSENKTFEKCGICKFCSYCGKDCQLIHMNVDYSRFCMPMASHAISEKFERQLFGVMIQRRLKDYKHYGPKLV